MTAGNARSTVLLEMRPALDGHAGIPQETRSALSRSQATPRYRADRTHSTPRPRLSRGLPLDDRKRARLPVHKQLDRLSGL